MKTRSDLSLAAAGILLALAASLMGGCVAWHSSTARSVSDSEFRTLFNKRMESALPVKIHVEVKYYSDLKTESVKNRSKRKAALQTLFRLFLGEAKWAEYVEGKEPDYVIVTKARTKKNLRAWSLVLGILTASVFPWVASIDYVFEVEIHTANGEEIGKHRIEATHTTMVELFMIFGMPFAYPDTVGAEMALEVFKDIFAWSKDTILTHAAGNMPK